jgi:hypothetical protein
MFKKFASKKHLFNSNLNIKNFLQWSGSFPVAKDSADQIAKRLDSLLGQTTANGGPVPAMAKRRLAGTRAELTISQAQGVQAHAVDNSKVGLFTKLTYFCNQTLFGGILSIKQKYYFPICTFFSHH